jgi:hypothetical protein
MFAFCLKEGPGSIGYSQLSDAWGVLFSKLFLSAEDLVDEMQEREHRLGEDNEYMLRDFIKEDCLNGGAFVLDVIKKGGNIDRAALIMIADLGDLAKVEHKGTTAIHILIDACDKKVRPVLIMRAGKKLLSQVYDRNGIPVLFSVFGLTDLGMPDLGAISQVFTQDDLQRIMPKNRTGKSAWEAFADVAISLRNKGSREKHPFAVYHAIKSASMKGVVTRQALAGSDKAGPDTGRMTGASERYASMMSNPLDNIGNTMRKSQGKR